MNAVPHTVALAVTYGYVGDGNIHLNVVPPDGIGRVKQKAFLERAEAVSLELAGLIKDALDPLHILSEGRILAARTVAGKGDR
jgi:FAD/FMN-containing dehydrogenase